MANQVTISTQVPPEIKDWIRDESDEMGISLSEWLNQAIQSYIDNGSNDLTFDDLESMSFDELCELVEEYDLDIDPDDCEDGWKGTAREKLRNAICDELEIKEEPEEE